MTHTPGPWETKAPDNPQTVKSAGGSHVAECLTYSDARLIAAAPDLLESLKHALDVMDIHGVGEGCGTQAAAKAAIKAAEGGAV